LLAESSIRIRSRCSTLDELRCSEAAIVRPSLARDRETYSTRATGGSPRAATPRPSWRHLDVTALALFSI